MWTIAELKEKYRQCTTIVEREQFLIETKEKYNKFATPALKRFLNSCIKEYNDDIARRKDYASRPVRELKRIFQSFETVWEMRQFILDIKGIYGDTKNIEMRKFLNDCTKKHNALIQQYSIEYAEAMAEYEAMQDGYPEHLEHMEYMEHEQNEQHDELIQKEHYAEVEKFPAFVNDAEEFLKNADYLETNEKPNALT
jgi:hypothetical protein